MKAFIIVVSHNSGEASCFAGVSEDAAWRQLEDVIRSQWWEDEILGEAVPPEGESAAKRYFDHQQETMWVGDCIEYADWTNIEG